MWGTESVIVQDVGGNFPGSDRKVFFPLIRILQRLRLLDSPEMI
jgi:hypothetical protein